MPHIQVTQAQCVLSNQDNYPEVIVARARNIVNWSNEKRVSIQWLWSHRYILKLWIDSKEGNSYLNRRKTAGQKLSKTLSRYDLNEFYKAHKFLGDTKNSMAMSFIVFDSLLKSLNFENIALMHRYVSCVNAERFDSTLQPVSFLRFANGSLLNEILLWRLLKKSD